MSRQPWTTLEGWRPCWQPLRIHKGLHLDVSSLSLVTDWDIPWGVTSALATVGAVYVRGWVELRRTRPAMLPIWRMIAFLAGIFSVFIAVASSLDTFSETFLFMHMAQHFVLMSVAPPLIVMGSPFVPLIRGTPRWIVRNIGKYVFRLS